MNTPSKPKGKIKSVLVVDPKNIGNRVSYFYCENCIQKETDSLKWVFVRDENLYKKVLKTIEKADRIGYNFNKIELSIFENLGHNNWDSEKINWNVLNNFEYLYRKLFN